MEWTYNRAARLRGTTLVELTVATALMATVFAAVMPVFAGLRRSAEARGASLEMLQNARVLNEHWYRHLLQATRIVAVGAGADDAPYLEFEGRDGVLYRYAVGPRGQMEFGPVGDTQELAGPVEYVRFVGYSAADLERPVHKPEEIRFITWEIGLRSPSPLARNRTVTGACCLRGRY
ncbi:MAG: hypothetical protein FJ280_20140 [Planctomycetes bacterium]|nr:hypothetical protein [Planctomycetota bacterium]